jgi:hypothetical protein
MQMVWDASLSFRDCPWCGLRHAQMAVLTHSQQVAMTRGHPPRYWALVACPDCGGAVSIEHNGPNAHPASELLASPQPADLETDVAHLPDDVAAYYGDAIKVLRAGVPDAAAVQLRRTLEAAAAHRGISEKTLMKSIQRLIDDGYVTKSFGDVLHQVRIIGNQGAHATDERLDEARARQALRFTTQLLRNIFEVPAELAALAQPQDADET